VLPSINREPFGLAHSVEEFLAEKHVRSITINQFKLELYPSKSELYPIMQAHLILQQLNISQWTSSLGTIEPNCVEYIMARRAHGIRVELFDSPTTFIKTKLSPILETERLPPSAPRKSTNFFEL
jgi:hypothetical protein